MYFHFNNELLRHFISTNIILIDIHSRGDIYPWLKYQSLGSNSCTILYILVMHTVVRHIIVELNFITKISVELIVIT